MIDTPEIPLNDWSHLKNHAVHKNVGLEGLIQKFTNEKSEYIRKQNEYDILINYISCHQMAQQ